MSQSETEFSKRDVLTAARGVDWRMIGAALVVPGICYLSSRPIFLLFEEAPPPFPMVEFVLTVLLIGQGIFAFGKGDEVRKWRGATESRSSAIWRA